MTPRPADEAVVFVHSSLGDARMWGPLIPHLGGLRTVTYDLRGHGEQVLPEGPYSLAADLLRLLDERGIGRCSLVGSSLGGRVALEVALHAPGRVSALVLIGSGLGVPAQDGEVSAYEAEEQRLIAASEVPLEPQLTARLPEIASPALVVVGREDAVQMLEVSRRIARELPRAELVELDGLAHLPSLEAPGVVGPLVRDFLIRV